MLAKEIKVRNLVKQRLFIEENLVREEESGDPTFIYLGHIFPEVKDYFREQGYDIRTLDSENVLITTIGQVLNIFTPKDSINITDKELNESFKKANPSGKDEKTSLKEPTTFSSSGLKMKNHSK